MIAIKFCYKSILQLVRSFKYVKVRHVIFPQNKYFLLCILWCCFLFSLWNCVLILAKWIPVCRFSLAWRCALRYLLSVEVRVVLLYILRSYTYNGSDIFTPPIWRGSRRSINEGEFIHTHDSSISTQPVLVATMHYRYCTVFGTSEYYVSLGHCNATTYSASGQDSAVLYSVSFSGKFFLYNKDQGECLLPWRSREFNASQYMFTSINWYCYIGWLHFLTWVKSKTDVAHLELCAVYYIDGIAWVFLVHDRRYVHVTCSNVQSLLNNGSADVIRNCRHCGIWARL